MDTQSRYKPETKQSESDHTFIITANAEYKSTRKQIEEYMESELLEQQLKDALLDP